MTRKKKLGDWAGGVVFESHPPNDGGFYEASKPYISRVLGAWAKAKEGQCSSCVNLLETEKALRDIIKMVAGDQANGLVFSPAQAVALVELRLQGEAPPIVVP